MLVLWRVSSVFWFRGKIGSSTTIEPPRPGFAPVDPRPEVFFLGVDEILEEPFDLKRLDRLDVFLLKGITNQGVSKKWSFFLILKTIICSCFLFRVPVSNMIKFTQIVSRWLLQKMFFLVECSNIRTNYHRFRYGLSRWQFQRLCMFTPTWGSDPTSLVLFKWVETTHQFFWSCRVTRCQQSHQQIVRISQGCRWWMRIGIGGCWHCWKILVNQDLQCFNHFPWWILSVDWRWDGEIMARYNVLICTVSYTYIYIYACICNIIPIL